MAEPTRQDVSELLDAGLAEGPLDAYWLAQLLAAIPVGVAIVFADDLRIVAANAAMRRGLQHVDPAITGQRIPERFSSDHPLGTVTPYSEVASTGNAFDAEPVSIAGRRWGSFIRAVPASTGDIRYLMVGLIDLGEAGSLEEVDRLRESEAAKREFLDLVAHELRTPLAVITGYASLLAPGGLSPEHQQLAGLRIYQKARQLSRLITGLTQVARLDEIGPGLPHEPIDLALLLDEIIRHAQRQAPDLAIRLDRDVLRAPLLGNREWLKRALQELVENGIRFRAGPGRVDVHLTEAPDRWRVTVNDDGMGIDLAEQPRLFKRFSRIETDANRHLVGLGIGLYLVRQVAVAHGGRVELQSTLGLGSRFTLLLPRDSRQAPSSER